MDLTGSGIEQLVGDVLASRTYTHSQDVDDSVAAVITVEEDRRFFPSTLSAVLAQSVLPGSWSSLIARERWHNPSRPHSR